MKYVYLTFRSVTAAMEAGRLLERAGLSARLLRTPEQLRSRGCGYSLRMRIQDLPEGKLLLNQYGAAPEKYFQELASGSWQEVAP